MSAHHPHLVVIGGGQAAAQLMDEARYRFIGAGFIGLESAAILRGMEIEVTLIAAGDSILPKLLDPQVARYLQQRHQQAGVNFLFNAQTQAFHAAANGSVTVAQADGRACEGDIVLVGIGAEANAELAKQAGLACDNGIVVDELAQTSDPDIVAAGDCTRHPNTLFNTSLRLETVHNAVEQGRTAGATIAGVKLPYQQAPWVWSDQYELRLQSVGVIEGYNRTVMRSSPSSTGIIATDKHMTTAQGFSLFYYRDQQLLAVNCINQPQVFAAVRRLLNEKIPLSPAQAGDPAFSLQTLLIDTTSLIFDHPGANAYRPYL